MGATASEMIGEVDSTVAPPRSAYIHVPFCRHRCGYCNFTLVAGRDDLIGDYLRAIELELAGLDLIRRVGTAHNAPNAKQSMVGTAHNAPNAKQSMVGTAHNAPNAKQSMVGTAHPTAVPREVDTLYFGGGTPTYLAPEQLRHLGETVLRWHPLAAGYEWTVEANPADVDVPAVDTLRDLGVTRLSLGGQSFRDEKLRMLERDHTGSDVGRAVELARDAGLQVALDLIFATPGETLDHWLA